MWTLEEFNQRLAREFDGRLRARYVQHRDEYHIEQKVGRAVTAPFRINSEDDDAIRARDGYAYVMTIRRGDRMPCPGCGLTLKVPVMRTAETVCSYCRLRGKNDTHVAAYYPLGDALIQHLRSIDPHLRGNLNHKEQVDNFNQRLIEQRQKDRMSNIEAGTGEYFRQLVGIPQFGYTNVTGWVGE